MEEFSIEASFDDGDDVAENVNLLVRIASGVKMSETGLAELFEKFDEDGGGTIDFDELRNGLKSIQVYLTDEEMSSLRLLADPEGDGELKYHVFASMLAKVRDTDAQERKRLARKYQEVESAAQRARARGY